MNKKTKKAKAIIEKDRRLFFSTTRQPYQFVAEKGSGDFAYDIDGNKLIDFSSFISVYNFGVNGNASVRNAIKNQTDKLMHAAFTDYYSELPVRFAETLLKLMPKGFGRMFLSNSGTEANEAAIKFARLFKKRQYVLAFYNSFHGRTLGSLSLTTSKTIQREGFGPFPNALHAPFAYCYRCPFKQKYPDCGFACVDYIRKYTLSKEASGNEVSAIFFEPIQGEGGYIVPPKDYFKEIKRLADDYGILLVCDEIQSGYMRTGKFLGLDNFGIDADMYTMAKAIGAGLPFGVTIAKSALGDIPRGSHATTFGGNLVSVSAALASLDFLIKNKAKLQHEILRKGRYVMKRLLSMEEEYEIVGDVRGIGLMIGNEIVKKKETKEPAIIKRNQVIQSAFDKGLLLLPSGESSIRIIPPLTVKDQSLEKGMDILEKAVREVNAKAKH
jgi:4-aminobutyrate aminotransferase